MNNYIQTDSENNSEITVRDIILLSTMLCIILIVLIALLNMFRPDTFGGVIESLKSLFLDSGISHRFRDMLESILQW